MDLHLERRLADAQQAASGARLLGAIHIMGEDNETELGANEEGAVFFESEECLRGITGIMRKPRRAATRGAGPPSAMWARSMKMASSTSPTARAS